MSRQVNRRRFLQSAAAAAAAPYVLTSTALGAPDRAPASERITLAGIGLGGQGRGNLGAFLGQGDMQVVGVCDVDSRHRGMARDMAEKRYAREKADGTWKGCQEYTDFREVVARDDIDTVLIATPDHWHCLVAVAAAKAGKDMYCEKPLSLTIRQGRVLSDTIRQYGRIFQTGSQQRSDGRFRFACELARNGYLGKLHTITCGLPTGGSCGIQPPKPVPDGFDYDMWLGPAPQAPYCDHRTHWDFRWILDYSGGQITDWGGHHPDIAQWGMGTEHTGPVEVQGQGEFPTEGLWNAAINYRVECKYANGVTMIVTNKFENGVKFEGDKGWCFVSRGRIDAEPKGLLSAKISPNEVNLYRSPGHHRNFVECVKSRRECIAPCETAHRSITIAHLGNIAMKLQRPLKWDPVSETFPGDAEATRMTDRAMRSPWSL